MAALRNKQDLIALDNSFPFLGWLEVLARPTVFASLSRMPSREHLLCLLSAYQPFAQLLAREGNPLALTLLERMRVLFRGWCPPDLPTEIVDVARSLLLFRTDGSYAVRDGGEVDWEKGPDLEPGQIIDQIMVWPPWEPRTMSDDIKWPPFEVKGGPLPSDNVAAIHATPWLMVLASPQVYRGLGRTPAREHLLHMLELYIAYVGHDGRYNQPMFQPVPYERRAPLAAKLQVLLEAWTPPELPSEITAAARELLYAEGLNLKWDNLTTRTIDPDFLRWPEGIPALLKDQGE